MGFQVDDIGEQESVWEEPPLDGSHASLCLRFQVDSEGIGNDSVEGVNDAQGPEVFRSKHFSDAFHIGFERFFGEENFLRKEVYQKNIFMMRVMQP